MVNILKNLFICSIFFLCAHLFLSQLFPGFVSISNTIIANEIDGYFFVRSSGWLDSTYTELFFKRNYGEEISLISFNIKNFESTIKTINWKTKGKYLRYFYWMHWNRFLKQLEIMIEHRDNNKKEFYAIRFKDMKPVEILKIRMPEKFIKSK